MEKKDLILVLHAYTGSPSQLAALRTNLAREFPDARIECPRLPAGLFSTADPEKIAEDLLAKVDALWREHLRATGAPYHRIILIGHSLGALLARKLYVLACAENPDAPIGPGAGSNVREWAHSVERLVLLAGMNRGWTFGIHLPWWRSFLWRLGLAVGWLLTSWNPKRLLILQIRRSAPFITQLRIQWLSLRRHASEKGVGRALTIQLLGSVDDMVSPADNVDLVAGRDFVYLDVPSSGHNNVVAVDHPVFGTGRWGVIRTALTADRMELEENSIPPADLLPSEPDDTVTDVVFVIHGIRDVGFWTQKIARRVRELGRTHGKNFRTETSSYGFFPMLPFILPWTRRAKVEWLMDEYVENLALYPKAAFSFVGHSNGTYLLSKAISDYRSCRFRNVVFAGSVVHPGYDWLGAHRRKQVGAILNLVASRDWLVALFPKGLSAWGSTELGGAGHDGFNDETKVLNVRSS